MGRRVHAVVSRSSGQASRERQPQVRVPSGPVGRGKKQRARVLARLQWQKRRAARRHSSLTIGLDIRAIIETLGSIRHECYGLALSGCSKEGQCQSGLQI
jgi:hypothetical protein